MKRRRPRVTFECPHCGAAVQVGSAVCRECGSDAATGWQDSEEVDYQGVEVPDGWGADEHASGTTNEAPRRWIVLTALLLAVFLAYLLITRRW